MIVFWSIELWCKRWNRGFLLLEDSGPNTLKTRILTNLAACIRPVYILSDLSVSLENNVPNRVLASKNSAANSALMTMRFRKYILNDWASLSAATIIWVDPIRDLERRRFNPGSVLAPIATRLSWSWCQRAGRASWSVSCDCSEKKTRFASWLLRFCFGLLTGNSRFLNRLQIENRYYSSFLGYLENHIYILVE